MHAIEMRFTFGAVNMLPLSSSYTHARSPRSPRSPIFVGAQCTYSWYSLFSFFCRASIFTTLYAGAPSSSSCGA